MPQAKCDPPQACAAKGRIQCPPQHMLLASRLTLLAILTRFPAISLPKRQKNFSPKAGASRCGSLRGSNYRPYRDEREELLKNFAMNKNAIWC